MIDDKSKQIVIQALNIYDAFDSALNNQYESWDLSCVIKENRIGIEIKNRENYDSKGYMDGINSAEEGKILRNRELIDKGVFDKVILVSIYNDGIMRVTDIMNPYELDEHYSPKTTYFGGGYKNKRYANFKHYKEYNIRRYI